MQSELTERAKTAWNSIAEEFNQWDALGLDEQETYVALAAALSEQQAVEDSEWHRSNGSMGDVLLYTLREDGWRRGKPMMVNDVMVRIERANGSKIDIEPIVQRIRSALVDVPAVEPVGEATIMVTNSGVVAGFTVAAFPADIVPAGTKLYTSPPLSREGEDSAEVIAKARALAVAVQQNFGAMEDGDGNEAPELAMARELLAATRSGSANVSKGGAE